ncbi:MULTISPECIES: hypothetical protein [Glycomyces]|uniref:Uncharacterized protein n=2 Tax=Glycomyces TaxID=58113 RepID=A0A9X3SWP8_9ACTN|nr:hypothetical protein [Glycomyces lechevalierae]MDA1387509.1 hypothetical protein [Glycomyces lechevalierae]MDR7338685.1 hypothetical protein [Glycomyces lechevalierae]
MTFNVRVALWFPLVLSGFIGPFGVASAISGYRSGDWFELFSGISAVFSVTVVLVFVFRGFALVKVTPVRIRSHTQTGPFSVALHPTDRLTVWDDRLFVVHANGYSTEVPVYRILLRDADWQRFIAEVARTWAPPYHRTR